jgi:hypothetical protein
MSDSLKATVIVRCLELTISAKSEVVVELEPDEPDEPDELEAPRLPAVVLEPVDDEPEEELPDDPLELEPDETASPGDRLSSDTTVPVAGA